MSISNIPSQPHIVCSDVMHMVFNAFENDWVSMAIPSDGSYGIEEGLIYSFPVTCKDGDYEIVQGLEIDDFSRERMDATMNELKEERDAVSELL